MKLFQLLLACVFTAVLTILFVHLLVQTDVFGMRFSSSQQIPYYFSVDEDIGMDLGSDMLRLGTIPPGAAASRNITLDASNQTVELFARGDGSEYISFSNSQVTLTNSTDIQVRVQVPFDASFGAYTGIIYIQRVNN